MEIRRKTDMFNETDFNKMMQLYANRDSVPKWEIRIVSDDGSRHLTISGFPTKKLDIWPDGWFMSIDLDYNAKDVGIGGTACPYKPTDVEHFTFEKIRSYIYKGLYLKDPLTYETERKEKLKEIRELLDSISNDYPDFNMYV